MLTHRLTKIILKHDLLRSGDKVIVGVSAGPDSVALLCLLCRIDLQLLPVAVYVDHGLRPEETKYEIHLIEKLAEKFNIPHEIITADVAQYKNRHKTSLEEAGRILRYEALEKCRRKHDARVIAVAHTADDQAEEILLRLIRGTGLKGLSGMRLQSDAIIRPLLDFRKNELIRFLDDSHISFCSDSSNTDRRFLRNRIRHELFPFLEDKFNPSIRTKLLQTAAILQEEEALLGELAETDFTSSVIGEISDQGNLIYCRLPLSSFLARHVAMQRRIIEKICWRFRVAPNFNAIDTICKLGAQGRNSSERHLRSGLTIYKTAQYLEFRMQRQNRHLRGNTPSPLPASIDIPSPGTYDTYQTGCTLFLRYCSTRPDAQESGTLILDGEKVVFPLVLRQHHEGEKFRPSGMQGSKKISRFLTDCKIPKHYRHLHPVLLCQDAIVAVAGLRSAHAFAADMSTRKFLLITWTSAKDAQL